MDIKELKQTVDALVKAAESQEQRIAKIESRLGPSQYQGTFPDGLESKPMHDEAVALQSAKEAAAATLRSGLIPDVQQAPPTARHPIHRFASSRSGSLGGSVK